MDIANRKLVNALDNVFGSYSEGYRINALHGTDIAEDSTFIKASICVDLSIDEIELPVFIKNKCELWIKYNNNDLLHKENKVKNIVIPLFKNPLYNQFLEFNTAPAALSAILSKQSHEMLKEIRIKGNVYYGGRGLILDKDFVPLLFCTVVGRMDSSILFKYTKGVVRVNPTIFDRTDILSKAIVRTVIPYYSTNRVWVTGNSYGSTADINIRVNPEIIIKDFSNMFIKTIPPRANDNIQDILNQILVDNVDEVLNCIE